MMTLVDTSKEGKDPVKATHYHSCLFNIVVDMLAIIIEQKKFDSQIERVILDLIDGVLSIL
jgi:hypothetical protein